MSSLVASAGTGMTVRGGITEFDRGICPDDVEGDSGDADEIAVEAERWMGMAVAGVAGAGVLSVLETDPRGDNCSSMASTVSNGDSKSMLSISLGVGGGDKTRGEAGPSFSGAAAGAEAAVAVVAATGTGRANFWDDAFEV
jgi:hypothetical protein